MIGTRCRETWPGRLKCEETNIATTTTDEKLQTLLNLVEELSELLVCALSMHMQDPKTPKAPEEDRKAFVAHAIQVQKKLEALKEA